MERTFTLTLTFTFYVYGTACSQLAKWWIVGT
jgi:hypothetical protein